MNRRSGAFLLTLLVAVAPMGRYACEVVCAKPQPPSASSSGCHDAASTNEGNRVHGGGDTCGETHPDSPPALFKGDAGRAHGETFAAVLSLAAAAPRTGGVATGGVLTSHGPPGPRSLSTNALTTILRI